MNFFLTAFLIVNISFGADKVFVACEGNYDEGNGSLWTITEDDIYEYQENPLGDIVQSLYVFENETVLKYYLLQVKNYQFYQQIFE